MAYEVSLSKKVDNSGRAELLIRARFGNIEQRAKTGLRIFTKHVREESYTSVKGRPATRLVITIPRAKNSEAFRSEEVKIKLGELIKYIDQQAHECDSKAIGKGWLSRVVKSFFEVTPPPQTETPKTLSIFEYFDQFLANRPLSPGTRNHYAVFKRILQRFEMYKQVLNPEYHITHAVIDADFLQELDSYIRKEHKLLKKFPKILKAIPESKSPGERGQNTINGYFKKLRAFIMWSIDQGLMTTSPFRKFKLAQDVYGTPYYISTEERHQIEQVDLSHRPALAVQRDIFVFHCCVGCRVSDLHNLTTDNVINGSVHYIARKTSAGHPVTIKVPLNKTAKEIIERYADPNRKTLLPFISDVKYNEAIKEIFTIAGLTRNVVVRNPLTGKQEIRPINEIASSHMARRTFVGNIYKKFKDQALVSELSGHAPGSRAFARYREVDEEMKQEMVDAID